MMGCGRQIFTKPSQFIRNCVPPLLVDRAQIASVLESALESTFHNVKHHIRSSSTI